MARQALERRRQIALAREIGIECHATDKLVPIDRYGGWCGGWGPDRDGFWEDQRVCDIALWAGALQLQRHSGDRHIIDHAWRFGFDDHQNEPWGFVTEPYIDEARARATVHMVQEAMAPWESHVFYLPKERSSWNPGGCVPIVVTSHRGSFNRFIREALKWALTEFP